MAGVIQVVCPLTCADLNFADQLRGDSALTFRVYSLHGVLLPSAPSCGCFDYPRLCFISLTQRVPWACPLCATTWKFSQDHRLSTLSAVFTLISLGSSYLLPYVQSLKRTLCHTFCFALLCWLFQAGRSICCGGVFLATKLCPAVCNPMDCNTPGFLVLHHLLELVQTHVH